jgi:RNase P/RNase MRP subunit p30
MQNLKICRKAGSKILVATFAQKKSELRTSKELSAFMFSLGASSQQSV